MGVEGGLNAPDWTESTGLPLRRCVARSKARKDRGHFEWHEAADGESDHCQGLVLGWQETRD